MAIGLDDQHVAPVEPAIELAETVGSGLHLDAKVPAYKRQDDIAGKTAADAPDSGTRTAAMPLAFSTSTIRARCERPCCGGHFRSRDLLCRVWPVQ